MTNDTVEQSVGVAPPDTEPPTADSPRGRFGLGTLRLDRLSGIYALVIFIVVFSIVKPAAFPTTQNVKVMADEAAITAIITLGLTISLATATFDLSIGATMSWSMVFVGWLQSAHHLNSWLAIVLTLLSTVVIGLVNGFAVVRLHVEPIITTMGTSAILVALAFWRCGGATIATGIPESFKSLGREHLAGIPISVIYVVVLAVVLIYVMEHTPLGRFMYATGGNESAARLAGIRVGRMQVIALVMSAVIAGIAGIVLTAKIGSTGIDNGSPYLLPAFAGAFLGSTQIRRGRFNVIGALVAVYLLEVGVKGLQLIWPDIVWIKNVFTGVVLIAAVSIAVAAAKRAKA